MLQAMEKLYSHVKDYHRIVFKYYQKQSKSKINISSELFQKDISLVVSHQGNLNNKIFHHVYYSTCKMVKFQCFSKNIKKNCQTIPKEMILQMMGILQIYHPTFQAWLGASFLTKKKSMHLQMAKGLLHIQQNILTKAVIIKKQF